MWTKHRCWNTEVNWGAFFMRRLLKFIIAGSVAAGTTQAFAGGLPETKATGDSA